MHRLVPVVRAVVFVGSSVFASVIVAPAVAGDGMEVTLTEEMAVQAALESNPGLAELEARAEALAAVPSQVGALPDPRISFGATNLPTDTFALDQEPMTQLQLGVAQVFPFPGKLGLREKIAALRAEAAVYSVDELRLSLAADVAAVWWQLAYLREATAIVARNQDLMREFVAIARTKYEVGKGLQQDVLLAELELSKLADLAIRLTGQTEVQQARLNALLDWPAARRSTLPDTVSWELPALRAEAALQEAAARARPLVVALEKDVAAAESAVALAKKDYFPDLDVSAGYGFRSGEGPAGAARPDFASVRLSVSVPIFLAEKQARAVDQRRAEMLGRTFSLADARARIRAEVASAVADYERARDSAKLFRTGIIPQARQTVASMLAGYQVNKVDFLNLVGAEITLYNYEMQFWQAVASANQALAALRAATGSEEVTDE